MADSPDSAKGRVSRPTPAGMAPSEPVRDPKVMARMAVAADLFEAALLMIRQNVLRRNPEAGEEKIDEAIRAWLAECPGAEHGDGEGVPRRRAPRRKEA